MAARRMSRPSPAALAAWRRRAIRRMTRSRAETLALVRCILAAALRRAQTQAAWSVRDVLVHIAAWEAEGARHLALVARGRGDRIVWYDTTAELDTFTERRSVQSCFRPPPRSRCQPRGCIPRVAGL